ncbi:MAG: hypothetical protein CSA29_04525 [Desulfobacterales bacterium]|nr:MAG: hypothetical protein CSA29_04525 [Desulfobacterales bacterium]
MPVTPRVIFFFIFVSGILAGCSEDEKFSGFSEMVAGRQQVRQEISGNNVDKQTNQAESEDSNVARSHKYIDPDKLSLGHLFEKKIEIIDTSSKITLAQGIAFLDKQGRIVRIKIIRN